MQLLAIVGAAAIAVGVVAASMARRPGDPAPAITAAIGVGVGVLTSVIVVQNFGDLVPDDLEGALTGVGIALVTLSVAVVSWYRWARRS